MKFNMGCGHHRLDGFVNVDSSPVAAADEVVDLEKTPWPWPDNCADEVVFNHSLEHMGAASDTFLAIICELYRICAHGAVVKINAPHPRHDNFIGDPTHVRIVTPQVMSLFDKAKNDEWKASNIANTPFGHYLNVDFAMLSAVTVLDEPHSSLLKSGAIDKDEIVVRLRSQNNVASEFRMTLEVRKPQVPAG